MNLNLTVSRLLLSLIGACLSALIILGDHEVNTIRDLLLNGVWPVWIIGTFIWWLILNGVYIANKEFTFWVWIRNTALAGLIISSALLLVTKSFELLTLSKLTVTITVILVLSILAVKGISQIIVAMFERRSPHR